MEETKDDLKAIIEALIFASEKPINIDRMNEIVEDADRKEIIRCIVMLQEEYGDGRGFYLCEVAEGYQFRTKPRFAQYLQKLYKIKAPTFSQAALETLAIIAYRQPLRASGKPSVLVKSSRKSTSRGIWFFLHATRSFTTASGSAR